MDGEGEARKVGKMNTKARETEQQHEERVCTAKKKGKAKKGNEVVVHCFFSASLPSLFLFTAHTRFFVA